MKKILCILFFLQYNALIYSWKVNVLPVSRDPMTAQWNILFGRDAGGQWSDFKMEGDKEKRMYRSIAQGLEKQTHGAYKLNAQEIETRTVLLKLGDGNFLCAIPLEYISDPRLHSIMKKVESRDLTKDLFVWLPIEEVFKRRTVVKLFRGQEAYKVDQDIRSLVMQHWNRSLAPALNALADVKKINVPVVQNPSRRYIDSKQNVIAQSQQKVSQARKIRTLQKNVKLNTKKPNHVVAHASKQRVTGRENV